MVDPKRNPQPEKVQVPLEKKCRKCGQVKPAAEFSKKPDGRLMWRCKTCRAADSRAYRETRESPASKAKRRAERVLWGKTPKGKAALKRWVTNNRDKVAARKQAQHLETTYGISVEGYDALLRAQGGVCAICGDSSARGRWPERFHVDHCHETGVVRGLLCTNCNRTLGMLGDNLSGAMRFVDYLRRGAALAVSGPVPVE